LSYVIAGHRLARCHASRPGGWSAANTRRSSTSPQDLLSAWRHSRAYGRPIATPRMRRATCRTG